MSSSFSGVREFCSRLDFPATFVHCESAIAMPRLARFWNLVCIPLVALVCSVGIHSDAPRHLAGRLATLPRYTLWAWERREDLYALNPHHFAVAYLDKTVSIGLIVSVQARRSPAAFPAAALRIPVVRIETSGDALLNRANRIDVTNALLASAREPGAAALQLDFDARRSQRPFYRELLFDLRRQLPPNLPLSITALASWCSFDDWLPGLPIDEAVPMLFAVEPDRRRAAPTVADFQIREPLCQSSVGVSTNGPWPSHLEGKRIYVFADDGWRADLPALLERRLP